MRTIVISDVHGHPGLIERALVHANFQKGVDRFVFAGDFLDGGPDPERAFELVDQLADVALFGNHEAAAMIGQEIEPQDENVFELFTDRLVQRAIDKKGVFGGRWRLATAEQGYLICHSCLSTLFSADYDFAEGDVERLAELVSVEFRDLMRVWEKKGFTQGDPQMQRFLGPEGPLWYRPFWIGDARPLPGIEQIIGHTPPEIYQGRSQAMMGAAGLHLVAPNVHGATQEWLANAYRYGLIEDGRVRVVSSPA